MLYYNKFVDDKPVPVKIIQIHEKRGRVEISRNIESKAGFWVNISELIEEPDFSAFKEWEKEDNNLWNKY